MKLLTTFIHERDFDINYHAFFDYSPADVEETLNFDEADAIFMLTHTSDFSINVSKEQLDVNGYDVEIEGLLSLNNYPLYLKDVIDEIANKVWDLPRIVYLERFGNPGAIRVSWNQDGSLPRDLREKDIPVASWDLSAVHPHGQYAPTIDNKLYYKTRETPKRPGTVTMMCDNIRELENSDEIMQALINCDEVTRINILLADDFIREHYSQNIKVNCLDRQSLQEMKGVLSDSEWTLNLHKETGMERMGIEGGMCGAHPIYIDSDFYRKHFSDDLGVAYVEGSENMIDNLINVLETGSDWDNHIEKFRRRLGSQYHMPKFWENVKSIIMEGK